MFEKLMEHTNTRRSFLRGSTAAMLSSGAVMLLAGHDAGAAGHADVSNDVGILNVALGLEHQGINAYTLGAQSGLLQKPVLDIALQFQADHKAHRDLLIGAIQKMGGKAVEEKPLDVYAKALNAHTLKNQEDILRLALSLELGATNAYLGVIPAFKDRGLAGIAGRLAADEVAHWAVLNHALGLPLPKPMLFGS
ncbi:ferritin-like domain-containing protein [Massilia sp. P8910]|uniref:ferritin-like domain-containing protein n=1 Tax=Massilia antarctica TaxID=2765360 RepID=UPI0006BD33AD|nr:MULTISPECIES: ferritin-like domain-containing protein [Massilia]MCE3605790.1 ferritin-like domain-containing protein [Massilia antarctica]MCY0913627.1 ferritin-like domain-containing protein [Massilia sp. H27-R4]CUI06033.1 putative exported protein [Janthinobacterium sp. CG23_2]CUU29819.1 putative exported protein [Janthinobacterium sp. CG23_2]